MHFCGSNVKDSDPEGSENRWRRLVVRGKCIPPVRSVAKMKKMMTHTDGPMCRRRRKKMKLN